MFGRQARIPVDLLYGTGLREEMDVNDYVIQQRRVLQSAFNQVQNRMGLCQDRQKELYNHKRYGRPFEVGDQVMLYSCVVPRGHSKKLHHPWSGPFKVLKKISDVTYRIQCCYGKRQRLVVHFNRLKLCLSNLRDTSQDIQGAVEDASVAEEVPPYSSQPSQESAYYILDDKDEEFRREEQGGDIDVDLSASTSTVAVGSGLESYSSENIERQDRDVDVRSSAVSEPATVDEPSAGCEIRRYPSRNCQPPARFNELHQILACRSCLRRGIV